jgi:hypothetical protein
MILVNNSIEMHCKDFPRSKSGQVLLYSTQPLANQSIAADKPFLQMVVFILLKSTLCNNKLHLITQF